MHSGLYYLDRSVVTDFHRCVRWERDLWKTEGTRIGSFAGTRDLEHWYHGEGHVWWSTIRPISSEAQVDVEEGRSVPLEPTRLDGYSSTTDRPICSVCRCSHATT